MILAGDVGGTKINLAYFDEKNGQLQIRHHESYPSRDFTSLVQALEKFRNDHPADLTAAAFGIAGPIVNGKSNLTNLGWTIDAEETAATLSLSNVGLVNDLGATAYGILRVDAKDILLIKPGKVQEHGNIAVIAAGTGLGEGGLLWDGKQYRAIASEGGHSEFGPRNETEIELLRFLWKKYDRASYERIISGMGLINLYDFFRSRADYDEPDWLREQMQTGDQASAISQAGLEGSDQSAVDALNLFASLYAVEAGNLALKILATGGVYIGGGIAPKILAKLQDPSFSEAFVEKGRYRSLMQQIPIYLIINDKAALFGAAHLALMER